MSRAVSFVPTCSRMSSLFSAQRSVNSCLMSMICWRSVVVVGCDVVAGVVVVVVVDAVDRRLAVAGATRVPADDVEALQQLLAEQELGAGGVLGAAESRPARVDQQRADLVLLVVGQPAGEEQLELRPVGIVVVDRHFEDRGLQPLVELAPLERRFVIGLVVGVVGGAGGVGRRRGRRLGGLRWLPSCPAAPTSRAGRRARWRHRPSRHTPSGRSPPAGSVAPWR